MRNKGEGDALLPNQVVERIFNYLNTWRVLDLKADIELILQQ